MSLSAVFKYEANQAVDCKNMVRVKVWHTHTTVWLLKNYGQRILTCYTRILLLDLTYGRTMIPFNSYSQNTHTAPSCSTTENFNRLSRMHERYRQTDRQTDGRASDSTWQNRDLKLIFISRGHVLRDWQWCKTDVTDRMFCLADENNGRRWRWRIYECSCCTCCVCFDRLSSEDVLVITSCTARARHKYS